MLGIDLLPEWKAVVLEAVRALLLLSCQPGTVGMEGGERQLNAV